MQQGNFAIRDENHNSSDEETNLQIEIEEDDEDTVMYT